MNQVTETAPQNTVITLALFVLHVFYGRVQGFKY